VKRTVLAGPTGAAGMRKLMACMGVMLAMLITTSSSTAANATTPTFADRGGAIIRSPQLFLIYWGRAWAAPDANSPTPDQVTFAMQSVLASPYLSGLAQYRNIGPAIIRSSTVIKNSDPPDRFTERDVTAFLDARLDAGAMAGPDRDNQALYAVMMPAGITPASGGYVGEHNDHTRHGQHIHFSWIAGSSRLDIITRAMSHEIVESLTDPEGNGIVGAPGTCTDPGWCEIADICSETAVIYGITVAPYWSGQARRCVAPYLPPTAADAAPSPGEPSTFSVGRQSHVKSSGGIDTVQADTTRVFR
jgi:hypothetical protein